jgi:hypothetical protein
MKTNTYLLKMQINNDTGNHLHHSNDWNHDDNRATTTTIGSCRDSILDNTESYSYEEYDRENGHILSTLVYRFQFTPEFMENLSQFSKIHQYDDRRDFKEAFEKWKEENEEEIHAEITRLTELGYRGNIVEKMFKSARYYFRKKTNVIKEPKTRCTYIGNNKKLLEKMDEFILQHKDTKPSHTFLPFCEENKDILKEEISKLIQHGVNSQEEITKKIKKTYKNRYFIVINK